MVRARRTPEQWSRWIARQRRSGLSVSEFCSRHGLALSTFHYWRRRLGSEHGPAFVEVTTASPVASAEAQASIELSLPRGVVARVRPGFDALLLRLIVEALS
jgi:transposase-like protein